MKTGLHASNVSSGLIALVALAGLYIAMSSAAHAQNQTVSGNFQVTGDATVSGALNVVGVADFNSNVTNFGALPSDGTQPGLVLTYTDPNNGESAMITFGSSRTAPSWQWERNSVSGLIPQMTLIESPNMVRTQ